MVSRVSIGAGGAHTADRIEPAARLAAVPDLDYLLFESISEISIGKAIERAQQEGAAGYSELLAERMRRVLPACREHDIVVVTNMGVAAPEQARDRTAEIARNLELSGTTVASVRGSDVSDSFEHFDETTYEGESTADYEDEALAAHAYRGVEGIVEALEAGADVVVTDRVADASLTLGPLVHEFGWSTAPLDSPERIGQGIVAGHLAECAGQVSGGYFADPGYKDVDGLSRLGFPIFDVAADGDVIVRKPANTGGAVTERTCKEQLLYEVHNPSAYLTPDGVANVSQVEFERIGTDRVRVSGGLAEPRPDDLKVNISYVDSFVGTGEKSYGGHGAIERANLAGDIVIERLERSATPISELRVDLIGLDSLHGTPEDADDPYEVRLRVAGRCETRDDAKQIGREVQRLGTNGPAGGGGRTMHVDRRLGVVSTLVPRHVCQTTVKSVEV